jgi:hypothetical protein
MTQQCQQLLRSVNNDSAVSTMTTQCKQWLRSVNNDSAVSTMTPQCQQWLRSVNNDSAMQQWLLTLKILWNLTQSLIILLQKKFASASCQYFIKIKIKTNIFICTLITGLIFFIQSLQLLDVNIHWNSVRPRPGIPSDLPEARHTSYLRATLHISLVHFYPFSLLFLRVNKVETLLPCHL